MSSFILLYRDENPSDKGIFKNWAAVNGNKECDGINYGISKEYLMLRYLILQIVLMGMLPAHWGHPYVLKLYN